jgi:glycosyltransferase involved in cell wall biosynthesis
LSGVKQVDNINNKLPKILIVSNNPFSTTSNNGKTLASFFTEFPAEKIAQLYFSEEQPDNDTYYNYYKISDIQVLKSMINFKDAGETVSIAKKHEENKYQKNILSNKLKNNSFFRFMREIMWHIGKWETVKLKNWISEFSPDIVFFCAGNSGFAYDVVSSILELTNSKLVTYITDDYILPRNTFSLFWWLHRNLIYKKMKKNVNRCDLFVTISEEMRHEYKIIFNKDSVTILNIPTSMKIESMSCSKNKNYDNSIIKLVYTGGLHYKRYNTLMLLGKSIQLYNKRNANLRKLELNIYSNQILNSKIFNKININEASKFCGSLNNNQLKIILNQADILVHVESFDKSCIEATRLSISTKIPEYLSLGKPIIAIGPSSIASMKYLSDSAFCITNENDIYDKLSQFIDNKDLKLKLADKAIDKYNKFHEKSVVMQNFKKQIENLFK